MDISAIKGLLQNREPQIGGVRDFGVLVPLIKIEEDIYLLFEVRAATLKNQPGEISFPGGGIEQGEKPVKAAVRETTEELYISSDKIDVLGPLDYIVTPFNYRIFPFAGFIRDIDYTQIKGNPQEVDHVFFAPLSYFINNTPACYFVNVRMVPEKGFPFQLIANGANYNWKRGRYPVYFYLFGDYIIWGITARIVKNLVDIIKSG